MSTSSPRKLIIDVDPGIGDALAVVLALNDPQIDLLGLTAVAGCISPRNATRNLQRIVEQIDPPKWPRIGAAMPLASGREDLAPLDLEHLSPLNGPSGLGDTDFPFVELHHRHDSPKLMVDLVRNNPHEITLLTLGPLTNVAAACERMPEFLSQLQGLVCLAGTVTAPGDITPVAELNAFVNPEAAHMVLTSPGTKTLVPLDISRQAIFTFDHLQRITKDCDSPSGVLLQRLLPYALRAHHHHLGVEGMPIREVLALAAVARPSLFKAEPMSIDVEVRGELTRGMTVFDRRQGPPRRSNIEVVTEVDVQGIFDYLLSVLGV